VLLPLGGWGLFAAAALDSSFISFAGGVDFWLVSQSVVVPSRMPIYALAATIGSLTGCSALYFAVRRGEEALLERHRSTPRFTRVKHYVEKYGAWSLFVVSFLPPPAPFKLFVGTSGLLKLPYRKFVVALTVGRSLRYFGEGFLTVRYGQQAWEWMIRSGPVMVAIVLTTVVVLFLTRKLRSKARPAES
jgi:membrane protein YqaA with SNARE-associated domain